MGFYRGNRGQPDESNMSQPEMDLLIYVHKGCDKGELLERPITYHVISIISKERVRGALLTLAHPDQYYRLARVATFVDGPHHNTGLREERDAHIDLSLASMNIKTLRIPLVRGTKTWIRESYQKILEVVNKRYEERVWKAQARIRKKSIRRII